MYMEVNGWAAMLAPKRSAVVTSEVKLMEYATHMPLCNHGELSSLTWLTNDASRHQF